MSVEMEANVTVPESLWEKLQEMDPTWTTTVLLVPCVVVLTAGFFYIYGLVTGFLSKTCVRNKVVVLSDATSKLGKGERSVEDECCSVMRWFFFSSAPVCASVFHKGGARLILCGKSWDKLEELAEDLTGSSDPSVTFPPKLVLLDFSDMLSLPEAIVDVLDCYGCLDVIILNNSLKVKAPAQNLSLEMDKLLMDNNYFGPATLVKGVLPSMMSRRTGHLILVNSIQGKLAVPFRSAYAASKHAVQAFFDCLRAEVEEFGISVSTINHTFISASDATEASTRKSFWSWFFIMRPHGVSPGEAAAEIAKTLGNKRKEVVIAPTLPKVAVYARSFFPNLFFALMAAGVNHANVSVAS
ncbi:dehydrogenase/reductase SDR family member 7C-B-like isoform X1 [Synchiropus splendidus]|uniref:dehydrogenase/reductase SDR family member 7C-B-like isoform X1 n=2 Tax=Synchiropus splendidus TaxID=270530 RepID=UPI00237DE8B7|nr:dehydrogenase/reductase SDR family member 7C-B-like isoform X1 [Synchiropus splendidus]XP_053707096.1 dehydrogenase/reductase SDR family member 7C-B-like isoform X1 [Synchiropus splendidus]